jgi:hypothetical protein
MKRLLTKIIVQPVWVEIDDEDDATELVSQPQAVTARELPVYVDKLLAFADQAKHGEVNAQPPAPDKATGGGTA